MRPTVGFLTVIGLMAVAGAAARADTSLEVVTPKNIKASTLRLTSKPARHHMVAFVITRDVKNIDGPGRTAYISDSRDGAGLGKPVKLEEKGTVLTYRFSAPEERVAETTFTLWGQGARGEGVTFELHLGEFWKPRSR